MRLSNKLDITLTLNNETITISKNYPVEIQDKEVLRDILVISADIIANLKYGEESQDAVKDYRNELIDKYLG